MMTHVYRNDSVTPSGGASWSLRSWPATASKFDKDHVRDVVGRCIMELEELAGDGK